MTNPNARTHSPFRRSAGPSPLLLRNEYVTRGIPTAPDHVMVEIVEDVYLPLVRGRGVVPAAATGG